MQTHLKELFSKFCWSAATTPSPGPFPYIFRNAGNNQRIHRARWQECIDRADVVTVLSHEYTKGCLFARNRYLVTQADILLACFDGMEGGTKNTVEYAQRNGCRVCLIPPVKKESGEAAI